jgi:hypothetical protein
MFILLQIYNYTYLQRSFTPSLVVLYSITLTYTLQRMHCSFIHIRGGVRTQTPCKEPRTQTAVKKMREVRCQSLTEDEMGGGGGGGVLVEP